MIVKDDNDSGFAIYPWERKEKPYFVNEEGFEWYYDKSVSEFAFKDEYLWSGNTRKGIKNVLAFFVKKGNVVKSILINKKQQILFVEDTSLALWNRVEIFKIHRSYMKFDEIEKEEEDINYINEIKQFNEPSNTLS